MRFLFFWGTIIPRELTAQYNQTQKLNNTRWGKPPVADPFKDPNPLALSDKIMIVGIYKDWADANGVNLIEEAGSVSVQSKQPDGTFKEIQILTSPNRQSLGHFGYAVATSGDYVAIGAPHEKVAGKANKGSVYIYKWDGSRLSLVWTLLGSAIDDMQRGFGKSLAMDGINLVVGTESFVAAVLVPGRVSVFALTGGSWIKKQVLMPSSRTYYTFGDGLAIDGGTIVVGAFWHDDFPRPGIVIYDFDGTIWKESVAEGYGIKKRAFAVDGDYIFVGPPRYGDSRLEKTRVYKKSGSTWRIHQIINENPDDKLSFGGSLAVSDGVAVIGAAYNETDAAGEVPVTDKAGSAYIFKLDLDGYWRQHQKITADTRVTDAFFGVPVATSGDVVAVSEGNASPSIYIFKTASFAGSSGAITQLRIYPKVGCSTCLVGGQLQVSNVGNDGPWTTVYIIPSQTAGAWNTYNIPSSPGDYKAVRYVGAYGSHCGVAEIEFYRGGTKLSGTLFADPGGAAEGDHTNAFDGKTDTFYYGQYLSGYIGMEVSSEDNVLTGDKPYSDMVFPNPVSGDTPLEIKSTNPNGIRSVNLYDRSGNLKITSEGAAEMDMSDMLPGVYYVHINYSDGNVSKHQIIKK